MNERIRVIVDSGAKPSVGFINIQDIYNEDTLIKVYKSKESNDYKVVQKTAISVENTEKVKKLKSLNKDLSALVSELETVSAIIDKNKDKKLPILYLGENARGEHRKISSEIKKIKLEIKEANAEPDYFTIKDFLINHLKDKSKSKESKEHVRGLIKNIPRTIETIKTNDSEFKNVIFTDIVDLGHSKKSSVKYSDSDLKLNLLYYYKEESKKRDMIESLLRFLKKIKSEKILDFDRVFGFLNLTSGEYNIGFEKNRDTLFHIADSEDSGGHGEPEYYDSSLLLIDEDDSKAINIIKFASGLISRSENQPIEDKQNKSQGLVPSVLLSMSFNSFNGVIERLYNEGKRELNIVKFQSNHEGIYPYISIDKSDEKKILSELSQEEVDLDTFDEFLNSIEFDFKYIYASPKDIALEYKEYLKGAGFDKKKKLPELLETLDLDPPTEVDSEGNKFWKNSNGQLHREGGKPAIEYGDGTKMWYKNGELHREEDKPAAVYSSGTKEWYINGRRHREEDKPAAVYSSGTKEWYINGNLHRENDKPAIECYGDNFWYINGQLHREGDKPAVERANGDKLWYFNDQLHRESDKPAIERASGDKVWYINGVQQPAPTK